MLNYYDLESLLGCLFNNEMYHLRHKTSPSKHIVRSFGRGLLSPQFLKFYCKFGLGLLCGNNWHCLCLLLGGSNSFVSKDRLGVLNCSRGLLSVGLMGIFNMVAFSGISLAYLFCSKRYS